MNRLMGLLALSCCIDVVTVDAADNTRIQVQLTASSTVWRAEGVSIWVRRMEREVTNSPGTVYHTDTNGTVMVELECGRTNIIRVIPTEEHRWYGEASVYASKEVSDLRLVSVAVRKCEGLQGRVVAEDGKIPCAGVAMHAVDLMYTVERFAWDMTVTDSNGQFRFPLLPEHGYYRFYGTSDEYRVRVTDVRCEPETQVVLRAQETAVLKAKKPVFRLQIVNEQGEQFADGQRVWGFWGAKSPGDGKGNRLFTHSYEFYTDTNGVAWVPFYSQSCYKVFAMDDYVGGRTFTTSCDVAMQCVETVRVVRCIDLVGKVVDEGTGRPIYWATVNVISSRKDLIEVDGQSAYNQIFYTDTNGFFKLNRLPSEGVYGISVRTAFLQMTTNIVLKRNENFVIKTRRERAIVTLALMREGNDAGKPTLFSGRCTIVGDGAYAMKDGWMRIGPIEYGEHRFASEELLMTGLYPAEEGRFKVTIADTNVLIRLLPAPDLLVKVRDVEGNAVAGGTVIVEGRSGQKLEWRTDAAGCAHGFVPPEPLTVSAKAPDSYMKPLNVIPDSSTSNEVTVLLRGRSTIVGRVASESTLGGIEGQALFITPWKKSYGSAVRNGAFEIAGITAEEGHLAVIAGPTWAPAWRKVSLKDKAKTDVGTIMLVRGVPVTFVLSKEGVAPEERHSGCRVYSSSLIGLPLALLPRMGRQTVHFSTGEYVVVGMEGRKEWIAGRFEVKKDDQGGLEVHLEWRADGDGSPAPKREK